MLLARTRLGEGEKVEVEPAPPLILEPPSRKVCKHRHRTGEGERLVRIVGRPQRIAHEFGHEPRHVEVFLWDRTRILAVASPLVCILRLVRDRIRPTGAGDRVRKAHDSRALDHRHVVPGSEALIQQSTRRRREVAPVFKERVDLELVVPLRLERRGIRREDAEHRPVEGRRVAVARLPRTLPQLVSVLLCAKMLPPVGQEDGTDVAPCAPIVARFHQKGRILRVCALRQSQLVLALVHRLRRRQQGLSLVPRKHRKIRERPLQKTITRRGGAQKQSALTSGFDQRGLLALAHPLRELPVPLDRLFAAVEDMKAARRRPLDHKPGEHLRGDLLLPRRVQLPVCIEVDALEVSRYGTRHDADAVGAVGEPRRDLHLGGKALRPCLPAADGRPLLRFSGRERGKACLAVALCEFNRHFRHTISPFLRGPSPARFPSAPRRPPRGRFRPRRRLRRATRRT